MTRIRNNDSNSRPEFFFFWGGRGFCLNNIQTKNKLISEILSFADDTVILLSESTVDILYVEANKLLNTIYTWFCKNKLKI